MKTTTFLLIICLFGFKIFGQGRAIEVTHYVFPEFTNGTVLMKSGLKNMAKMNYNSLTEEMLFESNGTRLAFSQPENIDTVYIGGRKFFPLQKKFVELIYHNKYDLYAVHKCGIVDPGKPAAYGGTTQTSSTTSVTSLLANGKMYEMKLPDGYQTKPYTNYWLKKDGKLTLCITLRQLSKQFDEKSEILKKYVKENKPDFENEESLIRLIRFLEQ